MRKLYILLFAVTLLSACKKDESNKKAVVWVNISSGQTANVTVNNASGEQYYANQSGRFEKSFPVKSGDNIRLSVGGNSSNSYNAGITVDGELIDSEDGNPISLQVTIP